MSPPGIWVKAALPALVLTAVMPFLIILVPSPGSILLTLGGLFFSLFYFFYKLASSTASVKSRGIISTIIAALGFILIFGLEYTQVQDKLLFGYKAVNEALSPALVNGDHYFGDKLLFRYSPLQKGDIYVIRDQRGKVFAARLLYFPGDRIAMNGKFHELKKGEYGFYSGHKDTPAAIVTMDGILAKAIVIYWCFDPVSNSPVWGRSGLVIH